MAGLNSKRKEPVAGKDMFEAKKNATMMVVLVCQSSSLLTR
jgi:hypothetical protein